MVRASLLLLRPSPPCLARECWSARYHPLRDDTMPQANLTHPTRLPSALSTRLASCAAQKACEIHVMQNKIAHASLLLLSALRNSTLRYSRSQHPRPSSMRSLSFSSRVASAAPSALISTTPPTRRRSANCITHVLKLSSAQCSDTFASHPRCGVMLSRTGLCPSSARKTRTRRTSAP